MTNLPPPPDQPQSAYPPPGQQSAYPPPNQPAANQPPPPGQIPPPPPAGSVPQAGPQGAPFGRAASPVPPPPGSVPVVKAPPVAWLIPLAALLAVIGVFTPWFTPHGQVGKYSQDFDSLYSFKDGKVGVVAPIALVALAVSVIGLLRGKVGRRLSGSADPVRSAGKYSIGVGVVSLVCLLIAWFMVTSQYKFTAGGTEYSWDDFESKIKAAGGTLGRGPGIGFWLTLVAGVLAIVAGIVILVQAKSTASKPTTFPPQPGVTPPAPGGYPQPGAYPPPQQLSLDKQPPPSA